MREGQEDVNVHECGCLCRCMFSCVYKWEQIAAPRWKSRNNMRQHFLSFYLRLFCSVSEIPSSHTLSERVLLACEQEPVPGAVPYIIKELYSEPQWRLLPAFISTPWRTPLVPAVPATSVVFNPLSPASRQVRSFLWVVLTLVRMMPMAMLYLLRS